MIAVYSLYETSFMTQLLHKVPMNRRTASAVIGTGLLKTFFAPSLNTFASVNRPVPFNKTVSGLVDSPDISDAATSAYRSPIGQKIINIKKQKIKDLYNLQNGDFIHQATTKSGPVGKLIKTGTIAEKMIANNIKEKREKKEMKRREFLLGVDNKEKETPKPESAQQETPKKEELLSRRGFFRKFLPNFNNNEGQ